MRTIFLATCFFALGGLATGFSISAAPIVDLGYARFKGTRNSTWSATTYFGLRYAAPPVGQARFRAPQPIEASNYYNNSFVVDATQQSHRCIQGVPGYQIPPFMELVQPGNEDCLLADIIVPLQPVSPSLPVLVEIHGGGYAAGDSESYPGYALVNQSQAIVYVAIQYRLNAFGFLSSPEIRADGVANAGLLDQREALEWVQRNIQSFGGDPQRVTIIGASAGGGSVMNQMILHGGVAHPPFRAVISELPWWQPYHNDTILDLQYQEVLSATNCSDLACLRTVPSVVLDAASQSATKEAFDRPRLYGYGDFYWGPSVDGIFIRDLPSNEFKQGHFTKVPVLIDHDEYEGIIFSNISETTTAEETVDLEELYPHASQNFFRRLYSLYPVSNFNSTFMRRQQIFGDAIVNCPTYYMATATSDLGLPTWKMVFNAGTKLHGATDRYLYNRSPLSNVALGNVMKDWFLSFTIHLDPNVQSFTNSEKPHWPLYQTAGSAFNVMNVQDANFTVQGDSDVSPQCDFFHGQSYVVRN